MHNISIKSQPINLPEQRQTQAELPLHTPNFLIIGAQKCGTTALYEALRQHPEIYMSPVKEPFYFALNGAPPPYKVPTEEYAQRLRCTWESYTALFQNVTDQCAIGEASAIYLSSYQPAVTAANIAARLPDVRLIALLRHPADRAYSAFQYYRSRGYEPCAEFASALDAERTLDDANWCPDLRHWQNGCYFANLKPYFDRFPPQQIRVYLYEEWNEQPERVLRDLFEFLGVDDKVIIEPRRANVTFSYRHSWLQRFLNEPTQPRQLLELILHGRLRARVYGKLRAYNRRQPPAFDAKLRRDLTERYRRDIEQLQTLINRDLSHWLRSE